MGCRGEEDTTLPGGLIVMKGFFPVINNADKLIRFKTDAFQTSTIEPLESIKLLQQVFFNFALVKIFIESTR